MHRFNSNQVITSKQDLLFLQQYVKDGLNIHQIQQAKLIFDAFDLNKTGLVKPKDIKSAIQDEGPQAMNNPLYQMICDIDREGAGDIPFDQFVLLLTTSVTGKEDRESIREMFQLFDDQKTGKISLATLRRAIANYHLEWEQKDVQEMIKQADEDKDGYVNFEQFYGIITYRPHF